MHSLTQHAAHDLALLVEEMLDLIQKYAPGVDVHRLRRIFRSRQLFPDIS